ncbi:hypothetical protein RN001_009120 [Aquatica leii]|uniref:Uncharacterized protein n=1 Tax=Aquatica leii TaxID=1421715 RepID=A0AAN7SFI0_9COLE|nr:hypothetical protein RN001_009120 [Aquatica leii]
MSFWLAPCATFMNRGILIRYLTNPSTSKDSQKKIKPQPNRKYDASYLQLGFIVKPGTENNNYPIPQCVVCSKTLSNQSMKPSLLKRHQTTKHPDLVDKPIEFFQRKSELCKRGNQCMVKFVNIDKKLVKASYLASYRIAKEGKPHTIGETLLLPVAKDMVDAVLGKKAAKEIERIPLSNDTLLLQLRECNYFALQVDESTDIKNMAQLLVFIRFDYQSEVKEEFLFCKPLVSNTKAEDIFNVINEYIMKAGISWSKSMSGHLSGLGARIKKVAPECQSTHCVIHREALASKGMPANLKSVLTDSVKVINFIKARALNSRLFSLMCEDMGGKYQTLLLHTEVRWLSRDKILTRLFELRSEIFRFLSEQNHDMKHLFNNEEWLSRLAYSADIFDRLNILNTRLQGPSTTVSTTNDKISSFKKKLVLFRSHAQDKDFSAYPTLASFLEENDISLKPEVTDDITSHMEALQMSFDNYFNQDLSKYEWIRNPFSGKFPSHSKQCFIDFISDSSMKDAFKEKSLIDFWIGTKTEYPSVFKKAIIFLLPFVTSHLRESGFSELLYIKNKYRNRIGVEEDLRIKLSSINPDIEHLVNDKQQQRAH